MALLSGGPAREIPAKWHRYPDRRLYTCKAMCKNRKKKNSYNIYDFPINRIYKKKFYNMYISVFRWGSRSLRNYFSNVKTKAIASDSREKTVRNAVNRGDARSGKEKFFLDVLLEFVGIHFLICGISLNSANKKICIMHFASSLLRIFWLKNFF